MKKLYLFLLVTFTSFQGFSQFYEGFEGSTFPPVGWLVTGSGANFTPPIIWTRTAQPNTGNWSAYMTRYNIGMGNTSQDWLITPQIIIPSNHKLFFSSRTTLAGNQGTLYQVRVSTSPNPSDLTAYTILQNYTENEISEGYSEFQENSIDLDAFSGQIVYIAFVRVFTQPTMPFGGDRWLLDDVFVSEESMYAPNNTLILNAFVDLNVNGIKDSGEPNFPCGSFNYQINSGNNINASGSNGIHNIFVPDVTNNYNLNYQINPE
ncbi:MAG: choice-of-anchor J domain-containing protein, partial [Candidatus Paceibacterota bacterium]